MALICILLQESGSRISLLPRFSFLRFSSCLAIPDWPRNDLESGEQKSENLSQREKSIFQRLGYTGAIASKGNERRYDLNWEKQLEDWKLDNCGQHSNGIRTAIGSCLDRISAPPSVQNIHWKEVTQQAGGKGSELGCQCHPQGAGRPLQWKLGTAFAIGHQAPSLADISISSIAAQTRGFQSSPPHASWFWPSKAPPPPSTSKEPPAFESDPIFSDPIFSDNSQKQKGVNEFGEKILPDASKGGEEVVSDGGVEDAVSMGGEMWGVLAPLSDRIVGVLDGIHSLTGLPWWLTIVVWTLLMRAPLLLLLVVQIKKTAQIGGLFQKVMRSGGPETPFFAHLKRFSEARKAAKCPNPAWFLAMPAAQIPLFVSTMLALRAMAADNHPGFDTGGISWFTDLTLPAGVGLEAVVFPLTITTLYLTNIQISFGGVGARSRFFRFYKLGLQALAVPALVGSFYFPQGLLLYWVTNNLCSLGQNLAIRNNEVRKRLNLPALPDLRPLKLEKEGIPITEEMVEKMGANELLQIAATCQAQRRPREAIKFLKKALVKSPDEGHLFYALGRTHGELREWEESAEYHGQAAGYAKDDDLRGRALYGSGIAIYNQGKVSEAVLVLREAARLRPDDLESQITLSSVLSRNGDKAEAIHVLRRAIRLEPKLQKYIDMMEDELRTQADAANQAKGKS